MVAIGNGIVNSYRDETYDALFWSGCISEVVLMFTVIILVKKIKNKTLEIKDL